MSSRDRVEQVTRRILDAFEMGEVPSALATVFLSRRLDPDSPCAAWSANNRLLVALHGYLDARGFRQWKKVGRSVRKGERAFHILGPCTVRAKEDDPDDGIEAGDPIVVGFRTLPVFGYRQTEGDSIPAYEAETRFLESLPLLDVARSWGISIDLYMPEDDDPLGYYRHTTDTSTGELVHQEIALGVRNLHTWAHELVHAADNRSGTLTRGAGQKLDNEIVAELGASALLEALGLEHESDRGRTWRYIRSYAAEHDVEPLTVCLRLLDRTTAAVSLLLDAAAPLAQAA